MIVNVQLPSFNPPSLGVPQGFVLDTLLFCVYASPLSDIMRKHNNGIHLLVSDFPLHLESKMDVRCGCNLDRLFVAISDTDIQSEASVRSHNSIFNQRFMFTDHSLTYCIGWCRT